MTRIGFRKAKNLMTTFKKISDTTRVRQPKTEKIVRDNQTNSIDLDLKGHDFIDSIMYIYYYG